MKKEAEVTRKDASPVTSAGSASPNSLVESIRSLTPGVPIISEDSEDAAEGLIDPGKGSVWWFDEAKPLAEWKSGGDWCAVMWPGTLRT